MTNNQYDRSLTSDRYLQDNVIDWIGWSVVYTLRFNDKYFLTLNQKLILIPVIINQTKRCTKMLVVFLSPVRGVIRSFFTTTDFLCPNFSLGVNNDFN